MKEIDDKLDWDKVESFEDLKALLKAMYPIIKLPNNTQAKDVQYLRKDA